MDPGPAPAGKGPRPIPNLDEGPKNIELGMGCRIWARFPGPQGSPTPGFFTRIQDRDPPTAV